MRLKGVIFCSTAFPSLQGFRAFGVARQLLSGLLTARCHSRFFKTQISDSWLYIEYSISDPGRAPPPPPRNLWCPASWFFAQADIDMAKKTSRCFLFHGSVAAWAGSGDFVSCKAKANHPGEHCCLENRSSGGEKKQKSHATVWYAPAESGKHFAWLAWRDMGSVA